MKINEVTSPLKHYMATVRVVINGTGSTARTTITADNQQQARVMLTRLYGTGNVLSISEVVSESPRICEIQRKASFPRNGMHGQDRKQKTGPVQFSCVAEAGADTRVLSPAELQVKSLSDKAKQYKEQAKAVKARQEMTKAQQDLMKASRGPSAS